MGEKVAEFIILRFRNQREIRYFEILSASFSRIPHAQCAGTPTRTPHAHVCIYPFVFQALGAKMKCVELHVGVQPAMKLELLSKVASLRMCTYLAAPVGFRHVENRSMPLSCWGQFCRSLRRLCAANGCPFFTFSCALNSVTCILKHSKCASSVFSQRVRFSRGPLHPPHTHQRFPRIPRAPKARAKKNWRFCEKYCAKIALKCRSRVCYSQILGKYTRFIILASRDSHTIHYFEIFTQRANSLHSLAYPPPPPPLNVCGS